MGIYVAARLQFLYLLGVSQFARFPITGAGICTLREQMRIYPEDASQEALVLATASLGVDYR